MAQTAHDLVVRGGLVADGRGGEPRPADVAVDGGTITAVGRSPAGATEEIDADGLLVTPGLRRHPHPLRRAGHLGRAHDAVELARRDHGGHGQLRRRLRAGATRCAPTPHLVDGRGRGHSRRRARRGDRLVLGELRRLPRRGGAAPARHRPVRAAPPRRAAPLRHGRAGGPTGGGDAGGQRGHAPPGHRGHAGRRHRLLDVAHAEPPHGQRRPDAVAARQHRRARGHRARRGRRRARRRGADLRLLARHRRRVRAGAHHGGAHRCAAVPLAGAEPPPSRGLARSPGPD